MRRIEEIQNDIREAATQESAARLRKSQLKNELHVAELAAYEKTLKIGDVIETKDRGIYRVSNIEFHTWPPRSGSMGIDKTIYAQRRRVNGEWAVIPTRLYDPTFKKVEILNAP